MITVDVFRHRVGVDLMPGRNGKCDACGEPLLSGQAVYMAVHNGSPWRAEDDENIDYVGITWHETCDQGSLAADAVAY